MKASTQPECGRPDEFPLARLEQLYDRGLYLQLYADASAFGQLENWPGVRGQVLAGKVAHHLGCVSRGRRIHARAFKRDKKNPYAAYYHGWHIMEYRGPVRTWDFLEEFGDSDDFDFRDRADLYSLRCRCAAYLRDFETAESWLKKAEELTPGLPWLAVERSTLAEVQDRYEQALETLEPAFAQIPYYRPAAQARAHLLVLLGKESEALEYLHTAAQALESCAVYAQLVSMQMDAQLYAGAIQSLEQYLKHAPLIDEPTQEWHDLRRCDALYFSGHISGARELAEKARESQYYPPFGKRLQELEAAGEAPKRKVLPIGFVRQHHMTCGPATLTSLSHFWGKPADHLEVAERICYDGTPAHSERNWAEQNGFIAREFRVTTDMAAALIDRGVPFTMATTEATSAHLQAVIGYDLARQSLMVRDPYVRSTIEFLAEKALERYAAYGPRGMAMVPLERRELLEELALPEAELYDQYYRLNLALEKHDREQAAQALAELSRIDPKHRLTIAGRRTLALYDGNAVESLQCVVELLEQFPNESHLQLCRVGAWRELGKREERIAWLKEICARRETDPVMLQELAIELSGDARENEQALRVLHRAARWRRTDAANLQLRANVHWSRREFARALLLYRFALCLEEKRENYAYSYFQAARYLGQTTEALAFLTRRFRAHGKKSAQPAMTLFWAYEQLDQMSAAFSILELALQMRPEDGDLLLYAAEGYGRYGNAEQAHRLLAAAKSRCREYSWYSSAALLREFEGKDKEALQLWEKILEREPLNLVAVRAAARLKDVVEGRSSALKFVENCCQQFPHHFPLHQLWNDYARQESHEYRQTIVDRIIELNPQDSWAWRERAVFEASRGKLDDALASAEKGLAIDPHSAIAHGVLGWVRKSRGEIEAAAESFRRSLEISVDNSDSMESYVECAANLEQKQAALGFIEKELARQTIFGDGVLAFRRIAATILAPEDLEAALRRLYTKRPDLWHTGSALSTFLADVGRVDEALQVAREAAGRFGLLPRVWYDLARVHKGRLEPAEEIAALKEALKLNPRWAFVYTQLAQALERAHEPKEAIAVLERGIAQEPRDSALYGLLGDFQMRYGDKGQALLAMRKAVEVDLEYRWAWNTLEKLSIEAGEPGGAITIARELTKKKPGNSGAWLALANLLKGEDQFEERIACIGKAIALEPQNVAAHELKCIALAQAGKWHEAAQAAVPAWRGPLPVTLRARAAWIDAVRGDLRGGIEKMRAVLRDDPSIAWGWSELCGWLLERGEVKAAEEAVHGLIRAEPLDPVSYGYAGKIKLQLEDKKGGKEFLQKALDLDPSYAYAALTLADLETEAGDFEAAEKLLPTIEAVCGKVERLRREAAIAARKGERKKTLELFREICLHKETTDEQISAAHDIAAPTGQEKDVEKVLAGILEAAGAHPGVGALYVLHRVKRRKLYLVRKLTRLRATEAGVGERAIVAFLHQLGRLAMGSEGYVPGSEVALCRAQVQRILKRHKEWLRADDFSWGMAGFALNAVGQHKKTVEWLADFQTRKSAAPWMLHNFVDSAHRIGQETLAREGIKFGLSTGQVDNGTASLSLWAALYAGLEEDLAEAERLFKQVDFAGITPHDKTIADAVEVLLAFLRSETAPRFDSSHRKALLKLLKANDGNKCMKQNVRRMTALISQRTGRKWPAIWGRINSYVRLW